jgi:uncharacterized protein (DUF736 family)
MIPFGWQTAPNGSLACRESLAMHRLRLGLHGCNRPAQTISPAPGAFLAKQILWASRSFTALRPQAMPPARPSPRRITDKAAKGATLNHPKGVFIMANIGTFIAQNDGFAGSIRTLTLNVKVKIVPTTKESEHAPDFRILAGTLEIGAAWRKVSKAQRPYLSVALDDPSFPATLYAGLVEGEDGAHNLMWSRAKAD